MFFLLVANTKSGVLDRGIFGGNGACECCVGLGGQGAEIRRRRLHDADDRAVGFYPRGSDVGCKCFALNVVKGFE